MTQTILVISILVCAIQAVRVQRLLASTLWLAGASASTAALLFSMSAHQVAVIELSVGGGLVTVLLVFAITLTSAPIDRESRSVPRPLIWGLTVLIMALLGILVIGQPVETNAAGNPVASLPRNLDLVIQIVLIFAGGLTVLGLLFSEKISRIQRVEWERDQSLTTISVEPEEKEVV